MMAIKRCALAILLANFLASHFLLAASPTPSPASPKIELVSSLSEKNPGQAYNGSLVMVKVNFGDSAPSETSVEGEFEGKKIGFFKSDSPRSWMGLFAIAVEHEPARVEVKLSLPTAKGKKETYLLPLEIVDGKYPSEILKVEPNKVNPPKKAMKKILAEQAEIGKIYGAQTEETYWKGPFDLPIHSQVMSGFGGHRVYNGEKKNYHYGLDLKAAIGTPIHAANRGRVVLAKSLYFTGNTVILDHGHGLLTLYAHMSKLKVKKGQVVPEGALLGLSGMTGRVTGPHLHWMGIVDHVKFNPADLTSVLKE